MARSKTKPKTKDEMYMNRKRAGELGRETVQILDAGEYQLASGAQVDISAALEEAVAGTVSYPPDRPTPSWEAANLPATQVEVKNETTLEAASRLVAAGYNVALLNFASAKNPGGGFQGGARAQEESLARSSGLFACIDGNPMYGFHRQQSDCLYSNYAIYSPGVPVIRHDDGHLLEAPYHCAMITSPAVNAGVVLQRKRSRSPEVYEAMSERIDKILAIAAHHGHDALVLGAWGCGVFKNQPKDIAGLFADALSGTYARQFRHITFAVLDYSKSQHIIGPFIDALA